MSRFPFVLSFSLPLHRQLPNRRRLVTLKPRNLPRPRAVDQRADRDDQGGGGVDDGDGVKPHFSRQ